MGWAHLSLADWKAAHGESWRLVRDEETGYGRFLYGGSTEPAFRPSGDGDFALLALRAVDDTAAMHGIDSATLELDRVSFLALGTLGSTDKTSVRFVQRLDGVPVIGGTVNVLFDMQGRLLSVDCQAIPTGAAVSGLATLGPLEAGDLARSYFFRDTGLPVTRMVGPDLRFERVVEGKSVVPRLVWEVEAHFADGGAEPEGFRYRIDAMDGSLSRREPAVHNDVSGNVQSMATPGAYPDSGGNPPTSQGMAHMTVSSPQGNAVTDANGDFTIPGATAPLSVTVTYDGTFVNTVNQSTTDYSKTTSLPSASGNVVTMNSSPTEFYTAEANSFLWINALRDWTRAVNPSDGMADFNARSNVNLNSTCNAYYDGVSVNFYKSGGGCVNTGYSSVVVHEMGHWLNSLYGSGNGSDGFGEGNADVFGMYLMNEPIVGIDFCGSGCNIRDGNNTRMFCGDSNPGCYGEVHADGEVLMGALWKVRTRLQAAHGTSTGGAIADLVFNSWMNAYDDGQIRTIIETHWLVLDDDDGDINNGTPNFAHIDGGFRDQGFPGFDFPFVSINNVTQLPTTADEVGPYTVNADVYAVSYPPLAGAELLYRVGGGSFVAVPMSLVAGNTHTADIPGQISPAKIEYYIRGTDNLGNQESFPADAPTTLLRCFIGVEQSYFFEDFEGGVGGWTHVNNSGPQDDWQHTSQVGSPNASWGKSGDPTYAPSGTNIWGNDLGQNTFNGAYPDNADNSLLSPNIDLSGVIGARLRFQRWLTIESGQYDRGDVLVNGHLVWTNPFSTDLIDTSWVLTEADISAWADGNASTQLEWNLDSDGGLVFGGWNIDDVEIFTIVAAPPTCAFAGSPLTGVAPLAVDFTDASVGNITGWSWDFGDGGSSTSQNPSHSYTSAGTYTVSLSITGPGGSDGLIRTDYVVVDGGVPVASFVGSPTAGLAPLPVSFTDTSSGAITMWGWDFGDGGTSALQHPSYTYTTPGTYTVALTVSGPGGADTATLTDYITVDWPAPTADFSGTPTAGIAPLLVDFTDASTGNVTGWGWDFGDGGTSALQHPSYTYTTPGTYTVALTVSGPGGADTATLTDYITVDWPAPTADFSGTPTAGIAPLLVDFTDASTGNVTGWSWDFGDGGASTAQHPSYTYLAPGTYTVALTVTGPGGVDTATLTDYITVDHPAPEADFTGTPVSGTAPLAVDFTDASTGTITGWLWDFGDSSTSSETNPSHTYLDPGTYTVSLTITGPGGVDTVFKADYITVNVAATSTVRNGSGVNPVVYDSVTLPILGTNWQAEIDGGSVGATGNTFVVGYGAPWPGFTLGPGEILLDPSSGNLFTAFAPLVGGIASYSLSLPADPIFAGFPVHTQGYLFDLGGRGQLTNAVDLVAGY